MQLSDIIAIVGGLAFERYGTAAHRFGPPQLGGEDLLETFTRADTNRYSIGHRWNVSRAGANDTLGTDWIDTDDDDLPDTPILGVGASLQNQILQSTAFDNVAWTKSNVTATANQGTSPDGQSNADRLACPATGTSDAYQDITSGDPNGETWTGSVWVKLEDDTSASEDITLRITNAAGGDPATTTMSVTHEWRRFTVTHTFSATSTGVRLYVLSRVNTTTGVAKDFLVWGACMAETFADRGYIETGAAALTRGVERLTVPWTVGVVPMSVYCRMIERGDIIEGASGSYRATWAIGNAAAGNRAYLWQGRGDTETEWRTTYGDGASVRTAVATGVSAVAGDTVELIGRLRSDMAVRTEASINGGNVSITDWDTTPANMKVHSVFGDAVLYVGHSPTAWVTADCLNGINAVIAARGEPTMAEFREFV